MDIFQMHPDRYININGLVIPLDIFVQWEPDYQPLRVEDGGLANTLEIVYQPGNYRLVKALDQRYIDLLNYPVNWIEGNTYISKRAMYAQGLQALAAGKQVTRDLITGDLIIPADLLITRNKSLIKADGIEEINIAITYPVPGLNAVIQWNCVPPDEVIITRESTVDNSAAEWRLKSLQDGLHTVTAEVVGIGAVMTQFYAIDGVI